MEAPDKAGSGQAARWTFITASEGHEESRRRAKSHTSREVKRRKAVRNNNATGKQSGRPQFLLPAMSARTTRGLIATQLIQRALTPSPTSLLGAGRVDPFAAYPIPSESSGYRELVDHYLHTAQSQQSKPQKRVCFLPIFRETHRVCWELAQTDPSAFHTILAISSADQSVLRDEEVPVEAIAINLRSIRMLRERISGVGSANLDGTIAAIGLQILFLLLFEDCNILEAHLDALESVVNQGGGVETYERSNPSLALLINLCDYLPPNVALAGRRRFHLTERTMSDHPDFSPIALLPPKRLKVLAPFDIYTDILEICLAVQRAAKAVFSGEYESCSILEAQLNDQLRDLTALGTSKIGWGRRCDIMKCICMAAILFLVVLGQRDVAVDSVKRQLLEMIPDSGTLWKADAERFIQALLRDKPKDFLESLACVLRVGSSLSQESWCGILEYLKWVYKRFSGVDLKFTLSEQADDPESIEKAGLIALFGFFTRVGSDVEQGVDLAT